MSILLLRRLVSIQIVFTLSLQSSGISFTINCDNPLNRADNTGVNCPLRLSPVLGVGFWPKLLPYPMLETASSTKVMNNKKWMEKSLSTKAAGIHREAFLSSVLFPHQKNHCLKAQNQPESFLIRKYHCLKPKTRTAVSLGVHGNLTNKAGIVAGMFCQTELWTRISAEQRLTPESYSNLKNHKKNLCNHCGKKYSPAAREHPKSLLRQFPHNVEIRYKSQELATSKWRRPDDSRLH